MINAKPIGVSIMRSEKTKLKKFLAGTMIALSIFSITPKSEAGLLGRAIGAAIRGSIEADKYLRALLQYANNPYQQAARYNNVVDEYGIDPNPRDIELVDNVMNQLLSQGEYVLRANSLPFRWGVNNSAALNAFCTMENVISVNKGIIAATNYNRDELAAVLAHEMIHGLHQHIQYGNAKSLGVQYAVNKTTNQSLLLNQLAGILTVYNQAKNISAPQENDADESGFYLMASAGFNPGGFAAMNYNMPGSPDESILHPDGHPDTLNRIKRGLQWMSEYSLDHVKVDNATIYIDKLPLLTASAEAPYTEQEMACFIAGGIAKGFHDMRLFSRWNFSGEGANADFLTDEDAYLPLKKVIRERGLVAELERMVKAAYEADSQSGNRDEYNLKEAERKEKLLEEREKALEDTEKNRANYESKSVAYRKLGLHGYSLYEANRLLAVNPQSVAGHCMRGLACKEFGEWKLAISEFDEVLKIDPSYASGWVYYHRSDANAALGNYEQALIDVEHFEKLAPGVHAETMLLQGMIYDKMGNDALALAAFNECHLRNSAMEIPEKYASRLN